MSVVSVPLALYGLSPHIVSNPYSGQAPSLVFTKHPLFLALDVVVQLVWAIYVMFAVSGPRGATVGMRVAKIRIVDTTYHGVSKTRAILRYLVHNPPVAALNLLFKGIGEVYGLIDVFWPLSNRNHQSVHDLIAKTYVILA